MRKSLDNQSRTYSKSRKFVFILIMFSLTLLVSDTILYIMLDKVKYRYNIFYDLRQSSDATIDKFYNNYFHSAWGWDTSKKRQNQLGARKSYNNENRTEYMIKTFGDSMVFGQKVPDQQTFQYKIEEKSGWSCLNYGVIGYGTDQALLKYKDNQIKTKYTILGILDENIARLVITWWNFYSFRDHDNLIGTKPRFTIKDGEFILLNNPMKTYDDLQMIKDKGFVNDLKKVDYWPSYHKQTNAPPTPRWPALLTIIPHLDFFVEQVWIKMRNRFSPTLESQLSSRRFYHLYQEESEAFQILKYIVDDFVNTAYQKNEEPILMLFPVMKSLDIMKQFDVKPYEMIINYMRDKQYNYIDFGDIFVQEKYEDYYQRDQVHFNVEGHNRVADELLNFIQQVP